MSIMQMFTGTWLTPFQQFQKLKEEGPEAQIKQSVIFVLVMGVLSGLITAVVAQFGPPPAIAGEPIPPALIWLSIVIVPAVALIGSFFGSGIVWLLVNGMNGSMAQYKSVYRVLAVLSAFSPISAAMAAIPKVGPWLSVVLNLWGIVLMIIGVITVLQTPPTRTAVILGVVFGILFSIGIAARIMSERQAAAVSPDFGELSTMNDNNGTEMSGIDDEKLNKELTDLANKAKEEAKQPAAAAPATKK